MKQDTPAMLELVDEIAIKDLLGGRGKRFEASGVAVKDGYLHIVFDDRPQLLRMPTDWRSAGEEPALLDLKDTMGGYEDIAFDAAGGLWYCLIEAAETGAGMLQPRVDEFDESFAFIRSSWLDFPVLKGNKGFEGLCTLRHAGEGYLLCLCEGNGCRGGKKGREPGKGRVQVFRRVADTWEHAGTVRLPKTVLFEDYSAIDHWGGALAVLSQASSTLWIGRLRAGTAEQSDSESPKGPLPTSGPDDLPYFAEDGRVFLFPRDDDGRPLYCSMEGVAWLGDGRVAVVSDRAKKSQPKRCGKKDQSVHIFRLPGLP